MEFETLKETLSEALNVASKAIGSRSNIPVLSNVLLKASGTKVYLYTTNLELHVITWIGAEVSQAGNTTVSEKRFLEYINTLPEGNLKVSLQGNELGLSSLHSKANFPTISAEEFPKIADIKENPLCTINSVLFFDAINAVAFCASKDDSRPTFTGIYIEIGKNYVDFVAIDGFRMAKKHIMVETGVSDTISFIVPSGYLEEITRLSPDKDEDIKLFVIGNKNQLGIRYKSTDFVIRLIEGVYPDYARVIPIEYSTEIAISRQQLADAVRTANIFTSQKEIGKIQFVIDKNSLTLKSSQKEIGDNETTIDCDVSGELGTITYNARFLQDLISHFSCDHILIRVVLKQEKPSVFYATKEEETNPFSFDDSYLTLMTPIKIEQ